MPTANNLDTAAYAANSNALYVFAHATASLRSQLLVFINGIKAALPNPTEAQRTVANWTRLLTEALNALPAAKANETRAHVADVGTLVFRVARAAQWAVTQGRLTASQGTAILNTYNAAWFPA